MTKYNVPTTAQIEKALNLGSYIQKIIKYMLNYDKDYVDVVYFKIVIDADPYIHSALQYYTYLTNGVIDFRDDITEIDINTLEDVPFDEFLKTIIADCKIWLEGLDEDTEKARQLIDEFNLDGNLYHKFFDIQLEHQKEQDELRKIQA